MTDVRARKDLGPAFDETPTLDRRQLLRAGAWAAPVLVLATAAPAGAATLSGSGNVPASALTPDAFSLSNANASGTAGPIEWAGGQVGYWNSVNGVTIATFTWTAVLAKPDGTSTTVASGAGSVTAGPTPFKIPAMAVAQKPLQSGLYKLTLTVYGSGTTSSSSQTTLTI